MTFRTTGNAIRKALLASFAAALLATAAVPAMAGAQTTSPTCEQYSPTTGHFGGGGGGNGPNIGGGGTCNQVQNNSNGGGSDPNVLSGRVGGLPFTGFDVLSMAAVALAVTGLGLLLQRAVSRPREEL